MSDDDITDRVGRSVDRAARHYRSHGAVYRAMWVAVGVIVVLAGLAMTVLPGPVTIVVPAGLVMLAAVFGWARRLLMVTVRKGEDAKEGFQRRGRSVKALTAAASGCLAAAAIALVVLQGWGS